MSEALKVFDEEGVEEREGGPLKRRAVEGERGAAKGGASSAAPSVGLADEGPGTVWNINKVKYYAPTPGVPSKQQFWGPNGDDKLVLSLDGNTVTSAAVGRWGRMGGVGADGLATGLSHGEDGVWRDRGRLLF